MFSFRNAVRTYARWAHRRPSRVILPREINAVNELAKVDAEYFEEIKNVEVKPKLVSQVKRVNEVKQISATVERSTISEKPRKQTENRELEIKDRGESKKRNDRVQKQKIKKKEESIVHETKRDKSLITDEESQLNYVKLSLDDPKISTLMLSVTSRKRRDYTKQIILEGKRLVRDALLSGLKPNAILFSKIEHLRALSTWLQPYNKDLKSNDHLFYRVTYTDLKLWSDVVTSPGIMGLFERPSLTYTPKKEANDITLPLTIICDNIREPSNMGAVIRTCAALPCRQLILTKGCCDPWDSKVLRGGAGGHFRLSFKVDATWDELREQLPAEAAVIIADSNSQKVVPDVQLVEYNKPIYKNNEHIVLVLGGETQSISNEAYELCRLRNGSRVSIPLARDVDSLNTATALSVISFEIRRQLLDK